MGIGLFVYGTYSVNGDQNAGSMYGLHNPFNSGNIISIRVNSSKQEVFKSYLSLLSPTILMVLIAWLSEFEAAILAIMLLLVILFSSMKKVARQLVS